nr:ATP-binding protein [Allomuricauda sp.]
MKSEPLFRTRNFDVIQELCSKVQEKSQMVGLLGYPGAGKTEAFKYYLSRNDNTAYMWFQKTMNPKEFYTKLLSVCGYENTSTKELSFHTIMEMIALRFRSTKGKQLLIIDEAGKFNSQQLEYIHELRDLTRESLGIILSGPEYFHDNLMKWKSLGLVGIPELESRITSYVWLERPLRREIKAICNHHGILDTRIIKSQFYGIDNFRDLMHEIRAFWGH